MIIATFIIIGLTALMVFLLADQEQVPEWVDLDSH